MGGVAQDELDCIFLATLSGDRATPNGACDVQKAIGARNAGCIVLNAACSGFVYALTTAVAYAKAALAKKMLVIGVETLSKVVDWSDRSSCVLFGDGAGCAVVEADDSREVFIDYGSNGELGEALTCGERKLNNLLVETHEPLEQVFMDGQEVYRFAVKTVPMTIENVLEKAGVSKDEIKYYVLHQANKRIIDSAEKRLKLDIEKFPMNLDRCSNTCSASVPILLDEINKKGLLERGDKIVMCGFGGGLTWGTIYLEW